MVGMPRISCFFRGAEPCIIMLIMLTMMLIMLMLMLLRELIKQRSSLVIHFTTLWFGGADWASKLSEASVFCLPTYRITNCLCSPALWGHSFMAVYLKASPLPPAPP